MPFIASSDRTYPSDWPPQAYHVDPKLVRPAQEKGLQVLLTNRVSETKVDAFLRSRPELLAACLNFTTFGHHGTWIVPQQVILSSQPPIANGLKPDYLVGGKGSEGFSWFVVELKGVRDSLFAGSGRSLRLSAVANRGLMQLLGYISYCSNAQAYLRDVLHLKGFREPQGFLIVGSERELEEAPERQAARQALNHAFAGRVQIRTFDALLRSKP